MQVTIKHTRGLKGFLSFFFFLQGVPGVFILPICGVLALFLRVGLHERVVGPLFVGRYCPLGLFLNVRVPVCWGYFLALVFGCGLERVAPLFYGVNLGL